MGTKLKDKGNHESGYYSMLDSGLPPTEQQPPVTLCDHESGRRSDGNNTSSSNIDSGFGKSLPQSSSVSDVSSDINKLSLESQNDSCSTKNFTAVQNKPSLLYRQVFLQICSVHFSSWNPKEDITQYMGKDELKRARDDLWEKITGDEDEDFDVLLAARAADERAVAFGLYVADSVKTLNTKNADWQTVLHVAAECCSPKLVRLLISRGADGAISDIWGNTPLHIAARFGRADVIKELTTTLERHELKHPRFKVPYKSLPQDNKDMLNHDGKTPIHLATEAGHVACVRALAKHGKVDMDYRRLGDGFAPLHISIDNGDMECMRACLEKNADLEVRNYKGETPQQLAYLIGRIDMVELCDEFGASPNQLRFAETEQVCYSSDEEMECDSDD